MRAIKYKYALALNLSIVEDDERMIREAIEEAINISEQLDIQVNLHNPFNNKSCLIVSYSDSEYLFQMLK